MNYFCCKYARRKDVILHPTLNGIDYLEVKDNLSDPLKDRQTTLYLHFLKPLSPGSLKIANFRIDGGVRIKEIKAIGIELQTIGGEEVLAVKVSMAGDFSRYTLKLVEDRNSILPPKGFDPVLSSVDFSFKVACSNDFDCKTIQSCNETPVIPPEINYLSKDYATFRQLMLDRISLLIPGWKERNPSDIGITLVELLAYVSDHLSYRQDAIATEAYISTARKRISVRRHARLVDYFIHDGCNARTWLHIKAGENIKGLPLKKGTAPNITKVVTRQEELPAIIRTDSKEFEKAFSKGAVVFELMHDIDLYTDHNEMKFYTWGEKECCLPKGATQATLLGDLSTLKTGDVLIFSEILGPETGNPQDADPCHRHAVRLTEVKLSNDTLYETPFSQPVKNSFPVTEIGWNASDALPFPFCIATLKTINNKQTEINNICVALGNNVLVDQGCTYQDEPGKSSLSPSVVPASKMEFASSSSSGSNTFCEVKTNEPVPARYNPVLVRGPLTHAALYDIDKKELSATSVLKHHVKDILPVLKLTETEAKLTENESPHWYPVRDLLNSSAYSKEFVVETESNGTAYLRFGDGIQGKKPVAGTVFYATYRIGNGIVGNIGANSLAHLVTDDTDVIASLQDNSTVWNPLPATGGMEPESMEEVKQLAPNAFRKQQRAVVPADYEEFSKNCCNDIQHTTTTFRWTGSWRTAFLTVDRLGGLEVEADYKNELRNKLERYRLAGIDLEIDSPVEVPLELEMQVCVNKNSFTSDIKAALLELFSNKILTDGRKGVFHPDNFSFGEPVYVSLLYAAAQSVQGVDSLKITKLKRQGETNNEAVDTGKLLLGRREIARLDNDPNFPDHGVFNLIMNGGR